MVAGQTGILGSSTDTHRIINSGQFITQTAFYDTAGLSTLVLTNSGVFEGDIIAGSGMAIITNYGNMKGGANLSVGGGAISNFGSLVGSYGATGAGSFTVNNQGTWTADSPFGDMSNGAFIALTGTKAANGTGDSFANKVEGNSGANVTDGALGADTLKAMAVPTSSCSKPRSARPTSTPSPTSIALRATRSSSTTPSCRRSEPSSAHSPLRSSGRAPQVLLTTATAASSTTPTTDGCSTTPTATKPVARSRSQSSPATRLFSPPTY